MLKRIKQKLSKYYAKETDSPFFLGLISGFYPFLFYYSNNFFAINSWGHLFYFLSFFLGIPILSFTILHFLFKKFELLNKYRKYILFVMLIFCTATLVTFAASLLIKKKILLGVLIVSVLASIKLYKEYRKVVVLIALMSVLPLITSLINLAENISYNPWMKLADDIEQAVFVTTPNVYMIQPDGYASVDEMEGEIYNFKSDLFNWLEIKNFKIYNNFRSNYPASLSSNASMFSMQQHYFGNSLFPTLEMPNAREIIYGDNPVVNIFKNNNYKTYFIVQDDYFQQNKKKQLYDYTNISLDEIKYFSDGNHLKKDVLNDLKHAFEEENEQPKFFFVEKLLPHHVHFSGPKENKKERERKEYIEKIKEVNIWLKETISIIEKNDPSAIIIVLADHGGWVGLESYDEMFRTEDEKQIRSIFGSIAAIKWNGFLKNDFDKDLRSNVNLFRVLFSVLSENKGYLTNLEDNSSYNLLIKNSFYKSVNKVLDDKGNVVYIKE